MIKKDVHDDVGTISATLCHGYEKLDVWILQKKLLLS